MENYMLKLINEGLQVGDTMRRHFGSNHMDNITYEVKEIASETVILSLVMNEVAKQQLKYKSISPKDVIIEISKCGSFPRYTITKEKHSDIK